MCTLQSLWFLPAPFLSHSFSPKPVCQLWRWQASGSRTSRRPLSAACLPEDPTSSSGWSPPSSRRSLSSERRLTRKSRTSNENDIIDRCKAVGTYTWAVWPDWSLFVVHLVPMVSISFEFSSLIFADNFIIRLAPRWRGYVGPESYNISSLQIL